MSRPRIIELRTRAGRAFTANGVTVTPLSRALTVRLPLGGFVWNRPVAVLVRQEGHTERIPIPDVTRMAQLSMLGCGLALLAIRRRIARRK